MFSLQRELQLQEEGISLSLGWEIFPSSQDAAFCPVVLGRHMSLCFVFHSPLSFLREAEPTSIFCPQGVKEKLPNTVGIDSISGLTVFSSDWSGQRHISSHTVWTKPCLKMVRTFVRCLLNTVIWSCGSLVTNPLPNPAGLSYLFSLSPLSLSFPLSLLFNTDFRGRYG